MSHLQDKEVFGAKSDVFDEMTQDLFQDLKAPHQETAAQKVPSPDDKGKLIKNVMWAALAAAAIMLAFK